MKRFISWFKRKFLGYVRVSDYVNVTITMGSPWASRPKDKDAS
jgi:hypothetical protein